jgi:porphobilinogen deaminase
MFSMHKDSPIVLATRGSALALAQANLMLNACGAAFPDLRFEIKVIRTTGDKFETDDASGSLSSYAHRESSAGV